VIEVRLGLVSAVALLVLAAVSPPVANARVERYAVLVGNNQGTAGDTPLRYAESDASRMYDVLHDLGGFAPANTVLLRAEDSATVRSTLIAVNDRIRQAQALPDTQTVLLVYYSGHADADDLHLGDGKLAIGELAQLVRGSAATFRLLVLDACRSGALTRTKGGRVKQPFALPEESLPGDGLAFLTASAESEDAQESDQLRASFFTHALVSGLLGAADRDGDGAVVLDEAYRYAYAATLRATSRTLAGTQHPSFRYDLRGQGELVLTRPSANAAARAVLHFPSGYGFLVMRDHHDGAVVAELSDRAGTRTLSLRPGRYFVRARGPDVLYEGALDARSGTSSAVDVTRFERIEYARLVRKGERASSIAHGPELGGRVRSALPNASGPCLGGYLGYAIDFEALGVALRASGCGGELDNGALRADVMAFDLETRLYRAWDVGAGLALGLGVGGGVSLFAQSFETTRVAPDRRSAAPFFGLSGSVAFELWHGLYAQLEGAAETHVLRLRAAPREPDHTEAAFAARASVGVGKRF
jgi:hypothetical protein